MTTVEQTGSKREAALAIVKKFRDNGHVAYWVGGCVRDMLLGATPGDYDIATDATPDRTRKLFRKTFAVGESFGVVLVVERGITFEIATFRSDDKYSDGRRPDSVKFSTPEEDAKRRDFTVNGMFYDPIEERIIDYVGGKADLERKIIRAIGDPAARFDEDKLRLVRASRFASRLDFAIDESTERAIIANAAGIKIVSAERVRDELAKILTGPRPRMGVELLSKHGLLAHILPEVEAMKGVNQPPEFHPEGDVWTHTMMALDRLPPNPEPELAFATLLHDVGKPPTFVVAERIRFDRHAQVGAEMALSIARRLRLSKREQDMIESIVAEHLKFMEVRNMRVSTLKRFMRRDRFDLHLAMHRADCLASHGDLSNHDFVIERLASFEAQEKEEALKPKLLVDGNDLIAMGMKPGPDFKRILEAIEDAQLENRIGSRDEAVELVKNLAMELEASKK